jgi:hypothetical protein
MQRRTFRNDGVMLSYLDAGGDGKPLIALHAYWMEAGTYADLAAALFGMASAWLIFSGALRALVGWLAGSAVLWFIGTRLLPGRDTEADLGQLLRTFGFAQTPGLFGVLAVLPVAGLFVPFAVAMWVIAATFVAVRQALDYDSTFRAILVCLLGWIVSVIVVYLTGFGATVVH